MSGDQIDNEQLISLVRSYPCLYDYNSKEYKSKQLKNKAWQSVSKVVAADKWSRMAFHEKTKLWKSLQKRWKSLRDAYARAIRMNEIEGKKKPYVYSKLMHFLLPVLQSRQLLQCSMDEDNRYSQLDEMQDSSDLNESQEESSSAVQNVEKPTILRFKRHSTDDYDVKYTEISNEDNDPDKMFLLSMLPYFEKLKPSHKLDVQIQFMQILKGYIDIDSDS